MSVYWRTDATIESKVHSAAKGPKGNMQKLLGQIQDYVEEETRKIEAEVRKIEAETHTKIPKDKIPVLTCPAAREWSILCSGKQAVLPTEARMRFYASEAVRRLASLPEVGSISKAYFMTAQLCLEQGNRFPSR